MKSLVKLSGVVLLMLCFGLSALSYLFFDAAQLEFKMEAGEISEASGQLSVIRLSTNEFQTAKSDDELWIGGQLYDIKSFRIVNDEVLVTVYHDSNEEQVIKNIVFSFEQSDQTPDGKSVHLGTHHGHTDDGKVLTMPYVIAFNLASDAEFFADSGPEQPLQRIPDVATPPPDCSCC